MENEKLFNFYFNEKKTLCRFVRNCKISTKGGARSNIYKVFDLKTFLSVLFCTREAAIMWLKRYGKEDTTYMLNYAQVRVWNHYVYFYDPDYELGESAESKKTCPFATRNN